MIKDTKISKLKQGKQILSNTDKYKKYITSNRTLKQKG